MCWRYSTTTKTWIHGNILGVQFISVIKYPAKCSVCIPLSSLQQQSYKHNTDSVWFSFGILKIQLLFINPWNKCILIWTSNHLMDKILLSWTWSLTTITFALLSSATYLHASYSLHEWQISIIKNIKFCSPLYLSDTCHQQNLLHEWQPCCWCADMGEDIQGLKQCAGAQDPEIWMPLH